MAKEVWKDIPDHQKHEVSSCGSIRRKSTKKKIKGNPDKDGYLRTKLKERGKHLLIHRVVAKAFIKNPKNFNMALHKDGNNQNNQASNLKWGDALENKKDEIKHGRIPIGEKHPKAKLSEKDVRWILKNKNKFTRTEMGIMFEMCHTTISRIILRKNWKHIK